MKKNKTVDNQLGYQSFFAKCRLVAIKEYNKPTTTKVLVLIYCSCSPKD
jgi:hypothetical protein